MHALDRGDRYSPDFWSHTRSDDEDSDSWVPDWSGKTKLKGAEVAHKKYDGLVMDATPFPDVLAQIVTDYAPLEIKCDACCKTLPPRTKIKGELFISCSHEGCLACLCGCRTTTPECDSCGSVFCHQHGPTSCLDDSLDYRHDKCEMCRGTHEAECSICGETICRHTDDTPSCQDCGKFCCDECVDRHKCRRRKKRKPTRKAAKKTTRKKSRAR